MKEQLLSILKVETGLAGWSVKQNKVNENQVYGLRTGIDTERTNDLDELWLTVYTRNDEGMGLARKLLDPAETLKRQLAEAKLAASLQRNQAFDLPEPSRPSGVKLADPMADSADMRAMAERAAELVNKHGVQLSSQEWYCRQTVSELTTSTGVNLASSATLYELELVIFMGENERLIAPRYRRLDDFDLEGIIAGAAELVKDLERADKPAAGDKQRVAISAREFTGGPFGGGLLHPLIFHAGGEAHYHQISRFKEGEVVTEAQGDTIDLVSDPVYDYGIGATAADEMGLVPKKVNVLEGGQFKAVIADARYGQYLGVDPTGRFGVMVLKPGKRPKAELLMNCLMVESFSALDIDEVTGDFFGEIRAGYAYDAHGRRRAVKGGGISGNLFTALRRACIPKEEVFLGDYRGPEFILFEELSISS